MPNVCAVLASSSFARMIRTPFDRHRPEGSFIRQFLSRIVFILDDTRVAIKPVTAADDGLSLPGVVTTASAFRCTAHLMLYAAANARMELRFGYASSD
jgi:hypothetical protein